MGKTCSDCIHYNEDGGYDRFKEYWHSLCDELGEYTGPDEEACELFEDGMGNLQKESTMKLTKEDISKFGTIEEKIILESAGLTSRELLIAIGEDQSTFTYGLGGNNLESIKQVGNQVFVTLSFDSTEWTQAEAIENYSDDLRHENPNFVEVRPGKKDYQVIAVYNIPKDKLKIHSMSGADAAIKLKELEQRRRILNKKLKDLEIKKDSLDSQILAVRNRAKRA